MHVCVCVCNRESHECNTRANSDIFIACITLDFADLPAAFMREVFDFVTELYHRGQTELEHRSHSHSDRPLEFNPYSLNVHSNAACVDLLFWAIKDEAGLNCVFLSCSFLLHFILKLGFFDFVTVPATFFFILFLKLGIAWILIVCEWVCL